MSDIILHGPNALYQTGKLKAKHDNRNLMFAKFLTPSIPKAPEELDLTLGINPDQWGMMRNDEIGDCTCASAGHLIQMWKWRATKQWPQITDDQIVAAYSAITGYNPVNGRNDNGANEMSVLKYWQKKGIAGVKITAYASIEPGNIEHVKQAMYLFEGAYIGVELPRSAQGQSMWSVTPGGARSNAGEPGSWGGHAVSLVAYNHIGPVCLTWGKPLQMTWQFFQTYCDEVWAVFSKEYLDSMGKTLEGFNREQLLEYLQAF